MPFALKRIGYRERELRCHLLLNASVTVRKNRANELKNDIRERERERQRESETERERERVRETCKRMALKKANSETSYVAICT